MKITKNKSVEIAKKVFIEEYDKDTDALLPMYNKLKQAKTIKEFLNAKQELFLAIVRMIDLSPFTCPYCIYYQRADKFLDNEDNLIFDIQKCEKCEYGKEKGVCLDSDYSAIYNRIIKAQYDLLCALADYATK